MEFLSKTEAEKFCFKMLQDDIDEEELRKIIELTELYELYNIEIEAYKKLGDKYFHNYKYTEAIYHYIKIVKVIDNIGESERLSPLYNRIGACLYAELRFQEALTYFDKANIYAEMYNDEVSLINSLYNMAMCYRRLLWIDKAIEYADMCIDKIKQSSVLHVDKYLAAHIVKINCYAENEEYRKALEISHSIIEELGDKESIVIANLYNNMGSFYMLVGDFNKSLKYYNKSEEIRRVKDPVRLGHTMIEKANLFLKQHLYIEAEDLLIKGIDIELKYNHNDFALRAYYYLIDVYEKLGCYEKIENTYDEIVLLLKDRNFGELKKVYLEMSKFYISLGKLDKADEFLKLSQEEM